MNEDVNVLFHLLCIEHRVLRYGTQCLVSYYISAAAVALQVNAAHLH